MKRNKHIKNFEQEKLRLRMEQLELEKQIRLDWANLKNDLKPRNFIANRVNEVVGKRQEGGFLSELLNYGIGYMSRKFSEKAGRGLEGVIKKGIDKLTSKL